MPCLPANKTRHLRLRDRAALAFQFLIRGPELRQIEALPADLQGAYQGIVVASDDAGVLGDAEVLLTSGEAAVERRDYDAARAAVADLRTLGAPHAGAARVGGPFSCRVPGEASGPKCLI